MARILVTGATGLIGAPVTRQLVELGHSIIAQDLFLNPGRLGAAADEVELVRGDVTDLVGLLSTLKRGKVERIVHLAGAVADTIVPMQVVMANCVGTTNVFEAARILDVERVCWASSSGVYGRSQEYGATGLLDEDQLVGPFTVYRASKVTCEQVSLAYRDQYDLDVVGIRPVTSYGVGRLGSGSGLIADTVRRVALGEPAVFPAMFGPREAKWQPMYAADIARTFVAGVLVPRPEHVIFNAPVSEILTVGETLETFRQVVPDAHLDLATMGAAESSADIPLLDGSRAQRELGVVPEYTFRTAIEEMISIYRQEQAATV